MLPILAVSVFFLSTGLSFEEKCSRCHMGMARYQAQTDGTDVAVLPPVFLDTGHYLHEAAMDGVSCTLCHQVQPDGLGAPDSFTGEYVIDTATAIRFSNAESLFLRAGLTATTQTPTPRLMNRTTIPPSPRPTRCRSTRPSCKTTAEK